MIESDSEGLRLSAVRRKRLRRRKYGRARHINTRKALVPLVRSGAAVCARCGEPIDPDEPWDLGHDDLDPRRYAGPEHAWCNRRAPGLNRTSREW